MPFDYLSTATLANIYIGLLGLAVLLYAILDGYDLGVGVLFPPRNEGFRDTMIASIGPYWDANETWLVLAVGLLLIAFPSAHSQILQALYLPATFMLLGLILRGVAFDFRAKVIATHKRKWDLTFKYGSLLTTLSQGYMLGIYVTGLRTDLWAQCFALLAAFGVTAAYMFIGACWLILKTEGELQRKAFQWAKRGLWVLSIGIVAVSVANLTLHSEVRELWLGTSMGFVLAAIPVACFAFLGLCGLVLARLPQAKGKGEWLPFMIALLVFFLNFLALGLSYYPYVIPGQVTILEALSDSDSLRFLLVGTAIVVPCILAYTVLVYRIFSGKAEQLTYY
ncbi:cytochrome d ubiquinol oxidase subunit II [Alteromonas aestuariivivens]|uniref:Cytochrome d ubiquinol oxidase subunit II n=1 Tax=Alteromonas aestuariivivens TaxID=1938339 RepID=A0A3D8M9G7_9ALTE|nr:cytochrome d ubiquinol oxidase subunit II [Alteromonas aestuariivivens]RDV26616.1 cytochrome d ubiquinol oxidase subunit II [Alteromonas aestuariivivens]